MPKITGSSLSEHHDQMWSALVTALEQCLKAKPYETISLAEIAGAAGIARNTIYNYATDKSAFVSAATAYSTRELVDEVAAIADGSMPPGERLSTILEVTLRWVARSTHRAIIGHAIFGGPTIASSVRDRIGEAIDQVVSDGVLQGVFGSSNELARELMGGVAQAAAEHVYHRPDDLTRVHAETIRIFLVGLRAHQTASTHNRATP